MYSSMADLMGNLNLAKYKFLELGTKSKMLYDNFKEAMRVKQL